MPFSDRARLNRRSMSLATLTPYGKAIDCLLIFDFAKGVAVSTETYLCCCLAGTKSLVTHMFAVTRNSTLLEPVQIS